MLNEVDKIAFQGLRAQHPSRLSPRQQELLNALAHIAQCEGCPKGSSEPCSVAQSLLDNATKASDEVAGSCCKLRRKIITGIVAVLPEEACGVPDSEMADVVVFDVATPSGLPVIAVRFCPWCGNERKPTDEVVVTELGGPGEDVL